MSADMSSELRYVDTHQRPVVAIRSATPAGGWERIQRVGESRWERPRHHHEKAQLVYTVRGIINLETDDGMWIVPPRCALWIPPHISHHTTAGSEDTECYCLFIPKSRAMSLPTSCSTLAVSPLMRELLIVVAGMEGGDLSEREERLMVAMLDELARAPVESMHLPMPTDAKLRLMAESMMEDPADKASLDEWASRLGMSKRSLCRLFSAQTGMGFAAWRRQLHIVLALQRLSQGQSVQTVALDLGYESASGFVTMFRKAIGKPPASYLAERNRKAA